MNFRWNYPILNYFKYLKENSKALIALDQNSKNAYINLGNIKLIKYQIKYISHTIKVVSSLKSAKADAHEVYERNSSDTE